MKNLNKLKENPFFIIGMSLLMIGAIRINAITVNDVGDINTQVAKVDSAQSAGLPNESLLTRASLFDNYASIKNPFKQIIPTNTAQMPGEIVGMINNQNLSSTPTFSAGMPPIAPMRTNSGVPTLSPTAPNTAGLTATFGETILKGTARSRDGVYSAIVSVQGQNKSVKEGDSVGNYTVSYIEKGTVVLVEKGGNSLTLTSSNPTGK